MRAAARARGAAHALTFEEQRWSWSALDALVSRWEQGLRALGVARGDRVATLSWNHPDVLALFFALGRLGAALVPLNARLTGSELAPLLEAAAPSVLLAQSSLAANVPGWQFDAVTGLSTELRVCARARAGRGAAPLGGSASTARAPAPGGTDALAPIEVLGEAVAAALFTSGTTGTPALIALTQDNFQAAARANASNLGAAPSQRWLLCLQLFHVGGLAMAHRAACAGASVVLERSFDAARTAALIARGELTHLSLVAVGLQRLLDAQGGARFPPTVEAALIGGGPVPAQLLARARAAGLPVLQTYGLTEACSQVCTERPGAADGTTAGPPLEGLQVRVLRDDGAPCAVGEIGLVEVQGPTVAAGLGPWLRTLDLGSLDAQGRLAIAARRVDLIVSGGENIYPAELEQVLAAHPAVGEVIVVPAADATWGQVPVAVFSGEVGEAELLTWCEGRLARFKVPRRAVRVEALPRNANGKIDRRELQELLRGP